MKTTSVLVTSLVALVMISGCATQDGATDGATGEAAITSNDSPLAADYDRKTAVEKQDILWSSHIAPTKYATLPPWPSVDLVGIMRLDLGVTLNRTNDELPVGRKKLVHALGSCAKVELVPDAASPYTGMFQGGVGLARFSLAAPPGTDAFTPALALKMLIDGLPSQNLQVMFSIDGQGTDFDFFSNRFSNIIAAPVGFGTNLIGKIFQKATPFPNYLDLDNFARHTRTGGDAAKMRAPHQVLFLPTSEVRAIARASSPNVDFRVDLAKVPTGTTVYEIVGTESANAPLVRIGKLVTRSEIIAARYGDEKLFFKHEEATKAP